VRLGQILRLRKWDDERWNCVGTCGIEGSLYIVFQSTRRHRSVNGTSVMPSLSITDGTYPTQGIELWVLHSQHRRAQLLSRMGTNTRNQAFRTRVKGIDELFKSVGHATSTHRLPAAFSRRWSAHELALFAAHDHRANLSRGKFPKSTSIREQGSISEGVLNPANRPPSIPASLSQYPVRCHTGMPWLQRMSPRPIQREGIIDR